MTSPGQQETGPLSHGPPTESSITDSASATNAAIDHVEDDSAIAASILQGLAQGRTQSRETDPAADDSAPNPAPITPVAENPATTATESPVVDNVASTWEENSVTDNPATITTKNPTTTAVVDTAFTCDTANTSENLAPPTYDTGVTAADETASPLAKATNPVLVSNSSAGSSIQNASTAFEQGDPPRPIHDEDAPFEIDDGTPLDPNAPTGPMVRALPMPSTQPVNAMTNDSVPLPSASTAAIINSPVYSEGQRGSAAVPVLTGEASGKAV